MIVVFAAMGVEVRACLGALSGARETTMAGFPAIESEGVIVCQTGLGRRAHEAASAILPQVRARAVFSVGTAGGLAPDIEVGDIVFCDRVVHAIEPGAVSGHFGLIDGAIESARTNGMAHRTGTSVTVDRVAWTPEEKTLLRNKGAPDVVEMESFWIGSAAAEKGMPFLAVRAVSDDASNALVDIPGVIDDHGNVNAACVLAYTRDHPEVIPLLAQQHERGGRALANLGAFLDVFLPFAGRLTGLGRAGGVPTQ